MSSAAVSLPRRFASLVKLEHTVCSLRLRGDAARPRRCRPPRDWVWVTVALVRARTLAMA